MTPGAATLTLHRGEIVGIAGLLGAGRTRLLRAIFGLEPVTQRTRSRVGAYTGPRRAARSLAAGDGDAERGSHRRGARGRPERRRQPDAVAARRRSGPAFTVLPARQDARRRGWIDRLAHPLRAPAPGDRASCPAATSRRWRSRGCCITTSTCWCSTSRRAASTSRSKAQIYALIDELVSRPRPDIRGRPAGQQLPAGAARRLRSHRGDVARPSRAGAAGVRHGPSTRC